MTRSPGPRKAAARRTARSRWETPRPFPGIRWIRTTLRTAHLIAFGTLYGGHVYALPAEQLVPALLATVASGATLMGVEMYRTPLWPAQIRGLATFAKIALIAAVGIAWELRISLLTVAIVIGGVVSHMPSRYRYYSVIHRRMIGEKESG